MESMTKRTLAEIDAEIKATKEALANVHGRETEVYARIVGYYRAVRNWNKGKADEFKQRKNFTLEASAAHMPSLVQDNQKEAKPEAPVLELSEENNFHYEFYFRQTCPNCPPVKAYVAELNVAGDKIDVDTAEGLAKAAAKGVFAAPTVIVYKGSEEIARAHNVEELSVIFEPVTAKAL